MIVVAAPAKLNLYLHVTGRRGDGYHRLDSLVAFADLGDEVKAEAADGLHLSLSGPFAAALTAGPDNLVLKAARALAEAAGVRAAARLSLTKRLPVASGLGGGSADAAATLRALGSLWRLNIPEPDLRTLGLRLGADVPVCLGGRAAFMGGIGEELAEAPPLPPAWLVLVNPGVAVSTPTVFGARRGGFSAPARFAGPFADAQALAAGLAERRNDLTEPAKNLAPIIGEVLAELARLPGVLLARMSGSGASCFGLFAGALAAETAGRMLLAAHPGWWVAPAALRG